MKYLTIIMAILLSSCGAPKISKTMTPEDFKSGQEPYFEKWSGGAPGSGSGVTLYFPTSVIEGHTLQAIYFQGMESNIANFVSNNKEMLVTRFRIPGENDNMSLDSKNEYGNETPKLEEFPFELLENEAVISFDDDGKTRLVKLGNIRQKETMLYPGTPSQSNGN